VVNQLTDALWSRIFILILIQIPSPYLFQKFSERLSV
jgi:hypothetical protein